jgi:hypothetical protein
MCLMFKNVFLYLGISCKDSRIPQSRLFRLMPFECVCYSDPCCCEHEDEELEPSVARASGQQDDAGDKPGYAPQATLDQFEMIRVDTMAKKELQKECEARDPFMDGTLSLGMSTTALVMKRRGGALTQRKRCTRSIDQKTHQEPRSLSGVLGSWLCAEKLGSRSLRRRVSQSPREHV